MKTPLLPETDDEMFQDQGPPLGSDPFQINETNVVSRPERTPSALSVEHALLEMFSLLNEAGPFTVLVQKLLDIFQRAVPSQEASILELDYKNRCLFFRAISKNSPKELLSYTVPWGAGIAGRVANEKTVQCLNSNEQSAAELKSIQRQVGSNTRNMVAVPVVIRGKSFCVVELLNRMGRLEFDESDIRTLESLSHAAAAVIENRLVLAKLSRPSGSGSGRIAA